MPTNQFDQPIGPSLGNWRPPPVPAPIPLNGRTVRLEPLDPTTHAAPLFEAFVDAPDSLWTYLQHGPFATADELGEAVRGRDVARGQGGKRGGIDVLGVARSGDLLAVLVDEKNHLRVAVGAELGQDRFDLVELHLVHDNIGPSHPKYSFKTPS